MKFLLIVCGLILALCGAIVSCGPQNPYCPGGPNGACVDNGVDSGTGTVVDTNQGESTIITGDETGP